MLQRFWVLWGFLIVVFHLGLIGWGLVPNLVARPLHLALAVPFIMFVVPRWSFLYGCQILLGILMMISCFYVALAHDQFSDQYGFLSGDLQFIMAGVLLLGVLVMAKQAIGWPLPIVATLALLYGLFGENIPGEFGHPGIPPSIFLGTLTIAEGGLWGSLTAVSVEIVAVFVILGAVMNAGEAGQGFMNIAGFLAGRLRGGAAKISLLSSALFGSISGSASANVASTGIVTLPTMKRLGYPSSLAGAVEAVASSGGQIMPPLMGAGAFVMVELTGESYTTIMSAAFLPALLYFFTVWMGIDAYAQRLNLSPLPRDERPTMVATLSTSVFFIVPFILLLLLLFVGGFTPSWAAGVTVLLAIFLLVLSPQGLQKKNVVLSRFEQALLACGKQVAMIASIIVCAAIIVGVLSLTGLGVKLTSTILGAAQGSLFLALLFTALACLLLGMEVPTTAAYVICVSVAGPALIDLGLPILVVHFFVFWFALLSTITPPVCGAVFIAASIAEANWLATAVKAMILGVGLYVIPFGMVIAPEILSFGEDPLQAILQAFWLGVTLWCLSFALIAKHLWYIRVALLGISLGNFVWLSYG